MIDDGGQILRIVATLRTWRVSGSDFFFVLAHFIWLEATMASTRTDTRGALALKDWKGVVRKRLVVGRPSIVPACVFNQQRLC